jgi:hypothetical protein
MKKKIMLINYIYLYKLLIKKKKAYLRKGWYKKKIKKFIKFIQIKKF